MALLLFRLRCSTCEYPLIVRITDTAFAANPIVTVRCMNCRAYNKFNLKNYSPL